MPANCSLIFNSKSVLETIIFMPITFIVLRSILGFSPPEWEYITNQRSGIKVNRGFARGLDRKIRINPDTPLNLNGDTSLKLKALVDIACKLIEEGAPSINEDKIHRLNKADTQDGLTGVRSLANLGVPYSMLLYERFLGRPFASHRDSVSELIGDNLEFAIESLLSNAGISYRKTKRAEKIQGFDQAPDFIIPDEFNPKIVIEAKITEDDGTARDKVTRIQHLGELSLHDIQSNTPKFEVIACIDGRGFAVRNEDMKKLLYATNGKVFTLRTLNYMIEYTKLKEYKTI